MKKISLVLCSLIVALGLFGSEPSAYARGAAVETTKAETPKEAQKTPAAQPAAHAPAPAPTQAPALAVPSVVAPTLAPIASQLGQTLQTLVGSAPTDAPPTEAQQPPPTEGGDDFSAQITDTFATGMLGGLAKAIDEIKTSSSAWTISGAGFSDFADWVGQQSSDPRRAALWQTLSSDFLIIVLPPFLAGVALVLFFIPLRLRLKRHAPRTLFGRIGLLVGLLVLRLIPAFVFLGGALLLLGQNETHRLPRFIVLNVIYAVTLGYSIQQILRGIFAPTTPHLRVVPLTTPETISGYRWLSSFCFVIIYSYFLIDVAAALHVPTSAILLFQNFFATVLTVMAVIAIFRARGFVGAILRGKPEDGEEETAGVISAMRLRLARSWHVLATLYLVVSLVVTLLGVEDSFALMLRGTIMSIAILVIARFGFVAVDKWKLPKGDNSPLFHRQILAFVLRVVLWLGAAAGIAATWGVNVHGLIATPAGQRIYGAAMSIILTLGVLTILYEMVHSSIDRHLRRRDKESRALVASARARTLLPMVRASVFVFFCAVAVFTSLSAVGINIAPLLAGAGVLGVAVGFGSQTLVKDFLTGLFIVVENTVAVGDTVKINDFLGVVETLSIRTIRLRDVDGALHILPFSEVSKITNMSRGFAYALVDIGVSYDCDLERVMSVMREIGASVQEDPIFKRVILEPFEVMGVQELGASSVTIRARMRTRPGKQFDVRRLLLLRIKQRFDKEHIEIPFPTVVQIQK